MVTSIARQSVIIKSKTGNSILLGNYECGYALGLLSKVAGPVAVKLFGDGVEHLSEFHFPLLTNYGSDQRFAARRISAAGPGMRPRASGPTLSR